MKVAITATGREVDSLMDQRFGRARWFLIFDSDDGSVEAVDNSLGVDANQGAGIQAAERVARQGVRAVITGHCGPKAFRTLAAAGISVYTGADGSAAEVFEKFSRGELKPTAGADVESHWL